METKELTVKQLEGMQPGIFAKGEIVDSPEGINMSNSGRMLKWVAVRGGGIPDWAIYCHFADKDWEWIRNCGDKVCDKKNIKKLVLCTDEAFRKYRY